MKQLKTALPFFLAVLLLSMSISIPIFLSAVQDKTILHKVNMEKIYTDDPKATKKGGGSIYDRLGLLQRHNAVTVGASNYYAISGIYGEAPLENNHVKQVLKELEKLRMRGGFPNFDLRKDLSCDSDTFQKFTFTSEQGLEVSFYAMSFSTSEAEINVWADADTYTVYQYDVKPLGKLAVSVDEETVKKVFTDYLSLSAKQFNSLYMFVNEDRIRLVLKYFLLEYN